MNSSVFRYNSPITQTVQANRDANLVLTRTCACRCRCYEIKTPLIKQFAFIIPIVYKIASTHAKQECIEFWKLAWNGNCVKFIHSFLCFIVKNLEFQNRDSRHKKRLRNCYYEFQLYDETEMKHGSLNNHYSVADGPNQGDWVNVQKTTFTNWVRENIRRVHPDEEIDDLGTAFEDGVRLVKLVEVVSGKKISKYSTKPRVFSQKLDNIKMALDVLVDDGLQLVNIGKLFCVLQFPCEQTICLLCNLIHIWQHWHNIMYLFVQTCYTVVLTMVFVEIPSIFKDR